MALFTKYAKNFTKSNFVIVLPFDQIVIAFKNIKIYKLNNEWHGFSWLHLFAVHRIRSYYNTTLKLNLVSKIGLKLTKIIHCADLCYKQNVDNEFTIQKGSIP